VQYHPTGNLPITITHCFFTFFLLLESPRHAAVWNLFFKRYLEAPPISFPGGGGVR